MRSRLEDLVELLREAAEGEHEDVPGIPIADTLPWEAADLIEWLVAALAQIRDGAADPVAVAADALDDRKWQAAGPADQPFSIRTEEQAESRRISTEQLIARLKGLAD